MKRIISIILTICMLIGVTGYIMAEDMVVAKAPISFTDVDKDALTAEAIYKMANAGIIVGDGDGTFRPKDGITRAELARIINLIYGYTEADEEVFADVKESDWYYKDVQIAKKQGYIVGFEDGTFRGNENVTRQQVCVILCKVANIYDLGIEVEINDEVADWARPYVEMAVASSLITLEDGNKFRATEDMTREEFCVPFSSFVETGDAEETPSPSPSVSPSPSPSTRPSGGGGGGGGGGGSVSRPTPTPTPDIATENADMIENLKACLADINTHLRKFPQGLQRNLINKIKTCIAGTIDAAKTDLIDANFVRTTYATEIDEAKQYYDAIQLDELEKASFQENLANLNSATLTWLATEFGLM